MKPSKSYSEKEVGVILRRAAELQASQGEAGAGPQGRDLTLDDLQRIGAEVGIDPKHVLTAASELENSATGKGFHVLGTPSTVHLERVVEGEMSQEMWEETVSYLRRTFADAGTTNQSGASVEWRSSTGDLSSLAVTVTSRNGRSRIEILREYSGALALSTIVTCSILLMSSLGIGKILRTGGASVWVVTALIAALFAIGFIAMHLLGSSWGRKDGKKLRATLEHIEAQIKDQARQSTSSVEEQASLELRLQ